MYVSLAPGMEPPAGVGPPAVIAARCDQYTSSDEEGSRRASTTDDRVAGKRPMAAEPSAAEAVPAAVGPIMGQGSTSDTRAPKRRWLIINVDDDDEEEEAAPLWSVDPATARMSPWAIEVGLPEIRLPRT